MKMTVKNIIEMLTATITAYADTAKADMSNAQKAYQLTEWVRQALTENRLSDFFKMVEDSINSLPANKITVKRIDSVTGKEISKTVKYREIAKRSFKTAWKNAVKDDRFTQYADKRLTFKLSTPKLEKVAEEKSLEDRIANMLGDTIDGKGLTGIMGVILAEQARHKTEVAQLAKDHALIELSARLSADAEKLATMGFTQEQVIKQLETLHPEQNVDLIKEAIG